ncbi:hypothetical protein GCM10027600_37230 [Nocardioides ginsengisegetis]
MCGSNPPARRHDRAGRGMSDRVQASAEFELEVGDPDGQGTMSASSSADQVSQRFPQSLAWLAWVREMGHAQ